MRRGAIVEAVIVSRPQAQWPGSPRSGIVVQATDACYTAHNGKVRGAWEALSVGQSRRPIAESIDGLCILAGGTDGMTDGLPLLLPRSRRRGCSPPFQPTDSGEEAKRGPHGPERKCRHHLENAPRSTVEFADPQAWHRLKNELYKKDWVVYAKPPFGGPEPMSRCAQATDQGAEAHRGLVVEGARPGPRSTCR